MEGHRLRRAKSTCREASWQHPSAVGHISRVGDSVSNVPGVGGGIPIYENPGTPDESDHGIDLIGK